MSSAAPPSTSRTNHAGLNAVGIFLCFASTMALFAGLTLVWKHSPLEPIWRLNPRAYQQLAPFGEWVGIPFLILSALLAVAAIGWFQRRRWAWWMSIVIIATQLLGDTTNLFLGRLVEGLTGILIATAFLLYLLRPAVRQHFP